ncbi:ABC transporter permease [Streptomyces sp. NPDC052043]|uniref:ABC transporter permease n=1 Tax=Streptomyces sp. NPDC052043 TaxID=3365684 RepID=UPI0037CF80A6
MAPIRRTVLGGLGAAGALAVWELTSRSGLVPEASLPPASATLRRLAVELSHAQTWTQTGCTLAQAGVALLLCVVIAVPLGMLIGRVPVVEAYTRSTVNFLRSVPGLALIPLFVLFLGARPSMVVLLTAFIAGWPLLIATIEGARSVEPVSLDMARSFRLGRTRTLLRVVVPAASPFIVTGLQLTTVVTLLVVVGSELIVSAPGLGQQMAVANAGGDGLSIFALSVWTGVLGVAVNVALRCVENKVMGWHHAATSNRRNS